MSSNWELITTILGSGIGGAFLTKLIEIYFLPKKEAKKFDEKVRDELWDRIKHLEGRVEEQNRLLLEIIKENAELKTKIHLLRNENNRLKEEAN
jgi:predicted nuclease with TOPRIM domain